MIVVCSFFENIQPGQRALQPSPYNWCVDGKIEKNVSKICDMTTCFFD